MCVYEREREKRGQDADRTQGYPLPGAPSVTSISEKIATSDSQPPDLPVLFQSKLHWWQYRLQGVNWQNVTGMHICVCSCMRVWKRKCVLVTMLAVFLTLTTIITTNSLRPVSGVTGGSRSCVGWCRESMKCRHPRMSDIMLAGTITTWRGLQLLCRAAVCSERHGNN